VQPIGGAGDCTDQSEEVFREAPEQRQEDSVAGHQFQHWGKENYGLAGGDGWVTLAMSFWLLSLLTRTGTNNSIAMAKADTLREELIRRGEIFTISWEPSQ
jgi:hypothetical protein